MHPADCSAEKAVVDATGARHRPEETVHYKVLAEHWRSFLAETDARTRVMEVR